MAGVITYGARFSHEVSAMRVEEIGRVIRTSNDADLRHRRKIAGLAGFAIADFLIGALYQTGVVRRIPDPRPRHVDSMGVMASAPGYPFGIPDTPLAIAFNSAIMALATAWGTKRSGRPAVADIALGLGALAGSAASVAYMVLMARQRRLCVYCIGASAAMIAIVPLAMPGLRRALRRLRR